MALLSRSSISRSIRNLKKEKFPTNNRRTSLRVIEASADNDDCARIHAFRPNHGTLQLQLRPCHKSERASNVRYESELHGLRYGCGKRYVADTAACHQATNHSQLPGTTARNPCARTNQPTLVRGTLHWMFDLRTSVP